jgi:hypothetical protein
LFSLPSPNIPETAALMSLATRASPTPSVASKVSFGNTPEEPIDVDLLSDSDGSSAVSGSVGDTPQKPIDVDLLSDSDGSSAVSGSVGDTPQKPIDVDLLSDSDSSSVVSGSVGSGMSGLRESVIPGQHFQRDWGAVSSLFYLCNVLCEDVEPFSL